MIMFNINCYGTVSFGYSLSNISHFRENILGVSLEFHKYDREHDTITIHIFTNSPQIFLSLTKAELDKIDCGNFQLVSADKIDGSLEEYWGKEGLMSHLCILRNKKVNIYIKMNVHCLSCKTKQQMRGIQGDVTSTGQPYVKDKCSVCGRSCSQFIKKSEIREGGFLSSLFKI